MIFLGLLNLSGKHFFMPIREMRGRGADRRYRCTEKGKHPLHLTL
jgi:hypothetical protein